jgi:hypothetical protein
VGNSNPSVVDPLAATGVGASSAVIVPHAFTTGTGVDPSYRVAPPDTTGDLGPNHYVQWVNLRYAIYDVVRDGTGATSAFNLVNGFPKNGNVVWQGFGGPCETYNDGDPIVQYDQLADRWILTQFAVSKTPYTQCVAVSTGGDPTGTYNRYSYSYGTDFNDYPEMGVWPDGYYITYNMFRRGRTFSGSKVCALERDRMLAGQSARQLCSPNLGNYPSLLPADLEGSAPPPANSPNYLLSITSNSLLFWKFDVNWTAVTGTLTGPVTVARRGGVHPRVQRGSVHPAAGDVDQARFSRGSADVSPQLSEPRRARSAPREPLRGVWRRQRHTLVRIEERVWSNAFLGGAGGRATGDLPTIGGLSLDGQRRHGQEWRHRHRVQRVERDDDQTGYPLRVRGPADPKGTLGAESPVLLGATGVQTGTLTRWGDYSTISVDPTDDCTMVFTAEYIPSNGSFNWATAIQSLKLSSCQ